MSALHESYRPSDEHEELRAAVRRLVVEKIAPAAAEVDEQAAFPKVAYDALRAADLHAVHVPEAYGGNGADALAACLVIEEVARGCASSSLIPAVNKLGSLPLLLAGDEELKQRYLRRLAGTQELDDGLRAWIAQHSTEECLKAMEEAGVVASKVYDMDDILADPIFEERGSIVTVPDADLGEVRMQAVVPELVERPGGVWRTAPALGEDNDLVYGEWLGLDEQERSRLAGGGVL